MASLSESHFAADFHGLLATVVTSLGVLAAGLLLHEGIRRWKRDTIYWRRKGGKDPQQLSSEDLGFGNLYEGRRFLATRPSPPLPRWPLQWVLQAYRLDEDWVREHCGIDAACYVRFLRACWFLVVSQLLTTFPTLLTINLTHASGNGLSSDDLARASLSSLIATEYGKRFLWLQVLFLYWLCFVWMGLIIWVGIGVLRHRKVQLAKALATRPAEAHIRAGWRFRTVLVANIPSDLGLRHKSKLVEYFEQGLQFAPDDVEEDEVPLEAASEKMEKVGSRRSLVSHVVLVRRSAALQTLIRRRDEALHQLEAAHIKLAKTVLHAIESYLNTTNRDAAGVSPTLQALSEVLEPFLDRSQADLDHCVWVVLSSLDRDLLDPYQPLYRLRKRFKGQEVPAIDYWQLKFRMLHHSVTKMQKDPESIPPAATAFVTFRLASDARRACRHLATHPTRLFAVKVRMAPDARDVIWEKIVRVSFRSDVMRSILTHTLIWFATLVWILPISLFVALVSLDNIAQLVPALAHWLSENPNAKAVLTSLVPTAIVSVISFFVPSLLSQMTMRVQHLFLVSKLHNRVGFRYFVWLQVNIVIMFSLGATVVKAVFTDPADAFAPDSVLGRIGAAFPAAAVFYVSWLVLTMGLQNGFEICLFGYAMIGANKARKASSPRRRQEARGLRQMNTYWWGPQTLTVFSVFAIFSLLNSLIICFALPYFTVSLLVLKSQFSHVYGRNFWESNGRNYARFLRFSLDSLMVTSVVFIAFFFINSQGRYGAAAIVMLVVLALFKLVATRWYKAIADALDITEADIYTGSPLHAAQDVVSIHLLPTILRGLPFFRKLVIRVPAILLSSSQHIEKRASLLAPNANGGRDSRNSAATETRLMLPAKSIASTFSDEENIASSVQAGMNDNPIACETIQGGTPSVRRHPFARPNDWPDHTASYEDPYLTKQLEPFMWLPRDPLSPIDLNDTIEWRGRALVSSACVDATIWAVTEERSVSSEQELTDITSSAPAEANNADMKADNADIKASLYAQPQRPLAEPTAARAGSSPPVSMTSGRSQSQRSLSGMSAEERILTAANVGSKSAVRASWIRGQVSPSSSHKQTIVVESGSSPSGSEQHSYFPPPRRAASDLMQGSPKHQLPLPTPQVPQTAGTISQAAALRQEILAEEEDNAVAERKEEKATRAEEVQEERKAAQRDSRRFFSRGSDTNRRSWLRRFADATDP